MKKKAGVKDTSTMNIEALSWSFINNQSVENAGVAFVKGANERNEFFDIIIYAIIYDEQVQTNN